MPLIHPSRHRVFTTILLMVASASPLRAADNVITRLQLFVGDQGHCAVTLDLGDIPTSDQDAATSLPFPERPLTPAEEAAAERVAGLVGLDGATAIRSGDFFRINHDFTIMHDVAELGTDNGQPVHGSIANGAFLPDPVKLPNGQFWSPFYYPRVLKAPFALTVFPDAVKRQMDFSTWWADGSVMVVEYRTATTAHPVPAVTVVWRKNRNEKSAKTLLKLQGKPGHRAKGAFTVPTPEDAAKENITQTIWSAGNDQPLRIRKIELAGGLVPKWSVQIVDGAPGKVVVKSIFPGPASDAGVKPGDTLVSIDGHPVTDVRDALRRLASYKIGQRATWSVARDPAPANPIDLTFAAK